MAVVCDNDAISYHISFCHADHAIYQRHDWRRLAAMREDRKIIGGAGRIAE